MSETTQTDNGGIVLNEETRQRLITDLSKLERWMGMLFDERDMLREQLADASAQIAELEQFKAAATKSAEALQSICTEKSAEIEKLARERDDIGRLLSEHGVPVGSDTEMYDIVHRVSYLATVKRFWVNKANRLEVERDALKAEKEVARG